jgi:cytochrome P450
MATSETTTNAAPYHVVRQPDEVREIFNRPDAFRSANALVAVTTLTPQSLRVLQGVQFALPPVLANNDGESHSGIRHVAAGFFTPAIIAGLEPRITELARDALGRASIEIAATGSADLVASVAAMPPVILMLEMLGLDARDLPQLKEWSRDSLELFWGWPDDERQLELSHSSAQFYSWLREFVADMIDAPERNLFRSLAEFGLGSAEICSLGYFLLIAAQETTSQLIATTLFRLLDGTVPVAWADAATRPGATAAVRHILRTESPGPTARRIVAEDIDFHGTRLPAGSEILLELTGNHGPESEPTAYSLAFGSGIHRCLGARLSELEATVIVQETASALPGLRLLDLAPDWTELLSFRAPRSVLVTA